MVLIEVAIGTVLFTGFGGDVKPKIAPFLLLYESQAS